MVTLGELISAVRKKRGMTREEVAQAVGVKPQAYARWEAGNATPSNANCAILCQVLEIPPECIPRFDYLEAKAIMAERGITQKELSMQLCINRDVLGKYLIGQYRPLPTTIRAMADCLNVAPERIYHTWVR